ncbi:nuclear transport factor 2 family protein [Leifsonia sp. 2MCAF36]|uniref:nuclear transport factor 2 family protein n=1 Tax=Leifsonia sp. 2MCAF36 TaxID=3232988 RepID=UPI003F98926C
MTDDRLLIHEVLNLHGHLVDEGEFDRFREVFTVDVVYDVSALGGGELRGIAAIADAGRSLGSRNPLAHHVTNVVVRSIAGDSASAISKGLGVAADGRSGSMVYHDQLIRTSEGWRISHRRVLPRKEPLQPSGR